MRLPKCLALVVFFALILFIVIQLETEIVSNVENAENRLVLAYQTVKEMRFKANLDYQIQSWLSRFRENLSQETDQYFARRQEPEFLLENLPPHTLTIARADKSGKMLEMANLAGKMDQELIRIFIDLAAEFKIEFSDHLLKPEKKIALQRCEEMMQRFLDSKTAKVNMIMLRASRFSIYNSEGQVTWFFWDKFLNLRGENMFVFSKLDLTNISTNYKFRSFLKNHHDPKVLCAYFDYLNCRFICNSQFSRKMSFKDLKSVGRECRQIAKAARSNQSQEVTEAPLHNHLAVIGRIIEHAGLLPVAVIPTEAKQNSNNLKQRLPAFAFFCFLVVFVVNAAAFARGPKMKVGTVLMLAMIFAILMPFMLGRSVFRLILHESYEKERLKIERNLHQSLSGIDNSYKTAQQNLKERAKEILKNPALLERIRQEENQELVGSFSESFVKEVIETLFAGVSQGYEDIPLKYRTANAFIISGPNDFLRYFNKYRGEKVYTRKTLEKAESMFMVLSLMKKKFMDYLDKDNFAPGFYESSVTQSKIDTEAYLREEARSRLKSSLGPERFHEIMHKNSEVLGIRSSFGEALLSNFAIISEGKYRYFASIVWDEFAFCPTFLRRAFALRREADLNEIRKNSTSLLARIDPANGIRRKPIVLFAHDGFRFDSFSSEESEPDVLSNLVKNTFRSKLLLRHETSGDKASIFEVYPPRNVTVYMIGAQQDITHLRRVEKIRSIMFIAGIVLFFLFAVAAAKNLSGSFTNPLQHLLWGLQMVEQNDYSIRLKDSREDEFGSISRAFNFMTRRLKEKDTLGQFVSDSVKKLAASPELLKEALNGAEEEVTIVFSNLEGFTRLAMEGNEEDVKAYLEFSLGRYFARAAEYGGEVDKVIGEKILIIFPHRQMGREKAVAAAIALARDIIADFAAEKELKPVFGINMGQVISGIIGAANVRMDLTVIGDPVNVAARLCSLADSKARPVVLSGQVNEAIGSRLKTEKVDIERVKGKRQEVEVYRLIS